MTISELEAIKANLEQVLEIIKREINRLLANDTD